MQKKIDRAIRLIQAGAEMAEKAGQPIEVGYSGGKDSDVILELTRMAGVDYRAIYKNTTIDPPGTIAHVKEMGGEVMHPKKNFHDLLVQNGYPSRFFRFCCQKLKEYKVLDYSIMGVRREESFRRAKRYKEPEECRHYSGGGKARIYYPILDWTLEDVKQFILERNIKLAPIYYQADGTIDFKKRLGCLGCPLKDKKKRIEDFKQYPNLLKLYIDGGGQYLDNHQDNTKLVNLWNGDIYKKFVCNLYCDNQIKIFEMKFGKNLFDDGINCKEFLEEQFNIKL